MIENAVRVLWFAFYGWFCWTNLRVVIFGLSTGVITPGGKTAPIAREAEPDRFGRSLAWRCFLVVFSLVLALIPLVTIVMRPEAPVITNSGAPATPPSP